MRVLPAQAVYGEDEDEREGIRGDICRKDKMSKNQYRLIFLGPPGAGKGTQAQDLERLRGCKHLSTGDILREEREKDTPWGLKIKEYMDKGLLVPDEIVLEALKGNINSTKGKGFILDGFPRNIPQARALEEILNSMNEEIQAVIFFDVDKEVAKQRLAGRRVCKECGKNYHLINMPPRVEGICDLCGGRLYQRDDDKEEVIEERWKTYNKESSQLIDYYKDRNLLFKIDANKKREEAFCDLLSLLDNLSD